MRAAIGVAIFVHMLCATPTLAQFVGLPKPTPMRIEVDKRAQKMVVSVNGKNKFTWYVSTGIEGLETISGVYKVSWLDRDHKSKQYDDAPMPYSIFFNKGQAIHGFSGSVGGRASHGCVRLSTGNARTLFNLVAQDRGFAGWKYDATIIVR